MAALQKQDSHRSENSNRSENSLPSNRSDSEVEAELDRDLDTDYLSRKPVIRSPSPGSKGVESDLGSDLDLDRDDLDDRDLDSDHLEFMSNNKPLSESTVCFNFIIFFNCGY